MKITAIELSNIRGFKLLPKTELSKRINVFIGANNSGKSTILNAIFSLQRDNVLVKTDITLGEIKGEVKLSFEGDIFGITPQLEPNSSYVFSLDGQPRRIRSPSGQDKRTVLIIPDAEPNNLIYPYLSKRKTVDFNPTINEQAANSVSGNFLNLISKIDRLVTPQFQPGNTHYLKACKDILGFEISTLASPQGKKGVYYVHNQEHIPLNAMGEGVTNIIGLITDLCVAENKIFLIEEPENDIHPKALKSLLNFIIEKSDTNQFFVSTHSNIVMKYLGGSLGSTIFNIKSELSDPQRPNLFISNLKKVPSNIDDRIVVLENLGYEFNDFGLWSAWLFLEESSAEVIIRDNLIKWFVPSLTYKLRTFSAGSTSRIKPKFDDFNKLFVFLHLEPSYKNKVWVYIDAGEEEGVIISDMRQVYTSSGWNASNFNQFSEHDFEKYYPNRFQKEVNDVLAISEKQEKRTAKRELLNKVKDWIIENEKKAIEEFKTSASEIIEVLESIKTELNKST
jgi:predicted ATPase